MTVLFPMAGVLVLAAGMMALYLKAGMMTILCPVAGCLVPAGLLIKMCPVGGNVNTGDQDLAVEVPDKQGQEVPDDMLAMVMARAIWDPGADPACAVKKTITENYRYHQLGIANTHEFKVSMDVEKDARATPQEPLLPDQELRKHVPEVRCQGGHDEDSKGLSLVKNNKKADRTFARYTERAVRRLIKLFSGEELSLTEDLARLDKNYGTGQHPLYTGGGGKNMFAQVAQVKDKSCNCREHSDVKGEYELVVKEEQAMQVGEVLVNPHQEEKNCTNDILSVDELSTNMMVAQFLRA